MKRAIVVLAALVLLLGSVGRVTDQWCPREASVIQRGYLVLTVVALLACVVAASRTM